MPSGRRSKENDVEDFFNLAGTGLNRSRKTIDPVGNKSYKNVTKNATDLHLDLFNFEDPVFEEGKYVLTSPRSLEACSRLSVKPVELLYKPLIEFQEELAPRGLSMRAIYETFDQEERERINKLQLCREEREKIVSEEAQTSRHVSPIVAQTPEHMGKSVTLSGKSSVREQRRYSDGEYNDLMEILEPTRRPVDKGSLQRARTAWATSIGHDRVTRRDIDKRSKEIHEGSMKKKRAPVSTKVSKSSAKAKLGSKKKKQQRLQKQQEQQALENGHDDVGPSVEVNSISSSRASRPWIKDPKADATPITDPMLREKLTGSKGSRVSTRRSKSFSAQGSTGPLVKQQDQKILKLMLAKREQERKATERRESARSAWEAEREKDAIVRTTGETVRRRSIAEERRRQIAHRSLSAGGSLKNIDSASKSSHDRNDRVLSKKELAEQERRKHHEEEARHSDRNWASATQRQTELKHNQSCGGKVYNGGDCKSCGRNHDKERHVNHQKLQEKKLLALERKKSVEERLELQKREMEDMQKAMQEKNEKEVQRASSFKDSMQHDQAMKIKMRNFHAKKRHEERMNRLKRQSMDELNNLRASFDLKERSAEQKLGEVRKQKEVQLRRQSAELDKRIKASRTNQKKLDEEIHAWHEDLSSYRRSHEEKADEAAKEAMLKKRQKAAEERVLRQKAQRQNLDKIMQQEEEWKADLEAAIALKESRAQMLQNEKDEMIQESRALAHSSQKLREELRQHYSMNDLDKWNKEAQLQSRIIDNKVNGITQPMSKVHLG